MNDFRFALRQLRKSPGFTSVAIVTLALGIGVNSAIFALVNGVVLRPMIPLRAEEVVNVFTARQNASRDYRQFSHTEYRDLRENSGDLFVDLAALEFAVAGIGRDHEMRRSFAFLTSENFFSLMGVQPLRGRFYNAEECRPNANMPVVVASYAFWKRMGGRNDFVGSNLQINGQPYTVIGITPDGFSGVSALVAPDIWLPLGVHSSLGSAFADSETLHDLAEPRNYALNLTARLKPGLTIDTAKSRLPALTQRFNAIQPSNAEGARELQIHKPSRFSISTSPARRRAGHAHRHATDGNGWRGAAHRQLESREHVAGPRHCALQGNRAASGGWRVALANRAPITLRRFAARHLRRLGRARRQRLVQRSSAPFARAAARLDEFFLRR